ncbi:AAA domain-containing protein, partial [Escherichia coli]|nr:AAA domain-containing protein [Escherichia coli]EJO9114906.1 AAA family ATPase [Escherichia coli]
KLINFLKQSFKGDEKVLEKVLAVWISGGHLLLNDRPGTGKTTLANSLAKAIDVDFKRIQFNPDLTPSDVTGVNTFNQETRRWEFHKGPVFSKVVLADEINRAPPRTQSALLEAMGEHQVSVDGITHALNKNFFVIATQNPLDSEGTYPLPEAENDRFAMMLSLGYLNENDELDIILGRYKPVEDLKPIFNEDEWIKIKHEASSIEVPESVARDVIRLINETRNNEKIINGASVRGG